jgi:hypothetical protein
MIERPQWYVQRFADSGVVGSSLLNVIKQLDTDAPFRLHSIAIVSYGGDLSNFSLRYTDPALRWVQRNLIPAQALNPQASGVVTPPPTFIYPSPVSPNMLYQPGGMVQFDFSDLPNFSSTLVFIVLCGTKIFPDGGTWAPSYPKSYRALPFFGYTLQIPVSNLPALDFPLNIQQDADFVWQAGQQWSSSNGLGVKIKDWQGKYYMDDYVPVEVLFGYANAQLPGLVYPEIYIPKNQRLYFDVAQL